MAGKALAAFSLLVALLQARAQINCYFADNCGTDGTPPTEVGSMVDCCSQAVARSYAPVGNSDACQQCYLVTITIEGTSFQFETIVDYEFTVRTDRAFGSLVTLRVFTVNVTAQEGQDYEPFNEIITLMPGSLSTTVSKRIVNDKYFEPGSETFEIKIEVPEQPWKSRISLGGDHSILIRDDDVPIIGFKETSYMVREREGYLVVEIEFKQGYNTRVSIPIELTDTEQTAKRGTDYIGLETVQLELQENQTSVQHNITIISDDITEVDETFTLNFRIGTSPSFTLSGSGQTVVTITEDVRVTVGFESTTYSVSESNSSIRACVGILAGTLAADKNVTVMIESVDGTATAPSDYTAVTQMEVTLTPSSTSSCVDVVINQDEMFEVDEIFKLRLTSSISTITLAPDETEITITDDDSLTIGFERATYSVSENTSSIIACVGILDGTLAADKDVTVMIESIDGTATAPSDYTAVNQIMVTLTSLSASSCVPVTINQDQVFEMDERFKLRMTSSISAITLDPVETEITITDDDSVSVSFKTDRYTYIESAGLAVVEVVLTGQTAVDVVVSVTGGESSQANIGPDSVVFDMDVTFTDGGPTEQTVSAIIQNDMIALEEDELVNVDLTIVRPASGVRLGDIPMTVVTIVDDDSLTTGLTQSEVTVNEDVGMFDICVEKSLQTISDVVLALQSRDGTATVGSDYHLPVSMITIPSNSLTQCTSVQIIDDNEFELTESFFVELSYSDTSNAASVTVGVNETEIKITDNDGVRVSFKSSQYTYRESEGSAVVEVVLTGETAVDVVVSVTGGASSQANIGPDRVVFNRNITFTDGGLTEQTVSATIQNDMIALEDDEQITVVLTIVSPTSGVSLGDIPTTVVTVVDDDSLTTGLTQSEVTVNEDVGTFEICVQKSLQTISDVVLDLQSRDGTAIAGSDYRLMVSMITIPANSVTQCTSVEIINDDEFELTENFFVELSYSDTSNAASVIVGVNETEIKITDNDGVSVSFKVDQYTYDESEGQADVVVVLKGDSAVDVVVLVTGGTDKVVFNSTITFTDGGPKEKTVSAVIEDDMIALEDDELITVDLTIVSPTSGVTLGDNPTTTVTIVDNDSVSVSFKENQYEFQENGGQAVVEVVLNGDIAVDVVVSVTGGLSSTVVFDSMLTFTPDGSKEKTVSGSIGNDMIALQDDEQVNVDLAIVSPTSGVTLGTNPTTVVTIVDDESLKVFFNKSADTVSEGDGMVEICVQKSHLTSSDVTLDLSIGSGNATEGSDYNFANPTTTILANSFHECFFVDITDDDEDENTENFFVDLSYSGDKTISVVPPSSTEISIEDDDEPTQEPTKEIPVVHVCTLSNQLTLQPFSSEYSFDISGGCEHTLVKTCKGSAMPLEIRVDFMQNDFSSTKVSVRYAGESVIVNEHLSVDSKPPSLSKIVTESNMNMVSVTVPEIMLDVTRNLTDLTVTFGSTFLQLAGLCGNLSGDLFFPRCDKTLDNEEDLNSFIHSYKVKPSDQFLREPRKECGLTAKDTVVHEPLMTVPIHVPDHDSDLYLCYEIQGEPEKYFNLVSDECTSVNAHYALAPVAPSFNIIDSISIVAVDNQGICHNISVEIDTDGSCMARVNGQTLQQPEQLSKKRSTHHVTYEGNGISVRASLSRVRISVPNCADNSLVVYVTCENKALYNAYDNNSKTDPIDLIKFEIIRGLNLKEYSHGLLGQFWNIPLTVTKYEEPDYYNVTVSHPSSKPRSFLGQIYFLDWDYERKKCLYAGNSQGGPGPERNDLKDSVIQGSYSDYITNSPFESHFRYAVFKDHVCS